MKKDPDTPRNRNWGGDPLALDELFREVFKWILKFRFATISDSQIVTFGAENKLFVEEVMEGIARENGVDRETVNFEFAIPPNVLKLHDWVRASFSRPLPTPGLLRTPSSQPSSRTHLSATRFPSPLSRPLAPSRLLPSRHLWRRKTRRHAQATTRRSSSSSSSVLRLAGVEYPSSTFFIHRVRLGSGETCFY